MDVRPSPLAGRWYPADALRLQAQVAEFLLPPPEVHYESVSGLLAPHAGMVYSGGVAGKAFRHVQGRQYDVVVVIAPSHYPYPAGLLSTAHDAYQTPLGVVPVAQDLLSELQRRVPMLPIRDDPEHSIEIELPFLQAVLGDFQLLPLAMIDQSVEAATTLAAALVELLADQRVLFVASSDLSHFYDQTNANRLDHSLLAAVDAYDPAGVIQVEEMGRGFACGRGAIAAVMLACQQRGATTAHLEGYATSGDVNGDFTRVVGYGAAVFCP